MSVTAEVIAQNLLSKETQRVAYLEPSGVFCKKMFLKTSLNLPEKTCVGFSLLMKEPTSGTGVLREIFYEFFKNI